MQSFQTKLALKASGQVNSAGTVTGSLVELRRKFGHITALLNVTAVGDSAEVADTLDVYVDATPDGGTTYFNIGRFERVTGVDGAKATGVLTLTGVIVPASHAESVLTANTILDGNTVTVGARTYTFKTTLSTGPTVADEVLIGGSDAAALDNLKLAINAGAGIGTNYSTGTVVNADVVATTNTDSTQKVVARTPGTTPNTLATTATAIVLSWPDTTLGGGTGASNPGVTTGAAQVTLGTRTYTFVDVLSETNGATAIADQVLFGADSAAALDNLKLAVNGGATAGTNYSTGTAAHAVIEATTNTDTAQTFLALANGTQGNIASTENLTNGGFATATLEGGTLGAGVAEKQALVFSDAQPLASQPTDMTADISSSSGGVRQIGGLGGLRYRSVVAGSAPDFTFEVAVYAKE